MTARDQEIHAECSLQVQLIGKQTSKTSTIAK